jgi:hypothetical protein
LDIFDGSRRAGRASNKHGDALHDEFQVIQENIWENIGIEISTIKPEFHIYNLCDGKH